MTVAVGRLQMSLTWEARRDQPRSATITCPNRIERAHRREQWARQVEADRARWRATMRYMVPWL